VKLLVDTHVFLWAITEDPKLSKKHRALWLDGENELWLSVGSVWEMLIKAGIGNLRLPAPAAAYIAKQMEKNRISSMGIRQAHFAELESLPPLRRDPFDRLLVAQARAEKMPILSVDARLKHYGVKIL
jgi:PIN domain nuclease of toxin-antitoxin system